ncbi:cytochrome d ubiquinol oxidase subunit II [Nonomuraea sp. NPDC050310]|uniref:cytochrome d ubiquinol oxidase subunit II n=1 Tax=Nonomuraea sp. NPDC050310 TaxID=3154935 RepID=UPI0033C890BD
MDIIWFVVFGGLLAGYFALEGFDLGVGMHLLGRPRGQRDEMVAAMAPFVLANEVWLIALAGAMFGVYPQLESSVVFALYPIVVGMLLSWVLRDAGLWFRRRLPGDGWRAAWDLAIGLGSLGLTLGWGLVLGALVTGSPGLLGLAIGVVLVLLFTLHGRTFLAWRTPEAASGMVAVKPVTLWMFLATGALAALPALAVVVGGAGYLLNHSAPSSTLVTLGLMVVPFAPIMVGAQVWVWRTFRRADRQPSFF